jgi:glyoxylase-like metal-dependent hydrolase (beta-lactamase superfamily II)
MTPQISQAADKHIESELDRPLACWFDCVQPEVRMQCGVFKIEELRMRCLKSGIALALLAMGMTRICGAQAKADESITRKAERQFQTAPLKTVPLGKGIFLFSGDGANIVAIADDVATVLVDSGIGSRVDELAVALGNTTHRPVTCLINTTWHFDHTGGNSFFGSSGTVIVAQENIARELASGRSIPFVGLRDGPYPPQALPTRTFKTNLALEQGLEQLDLINYGSAHTDGDTVVFMAPDNIAIVGDIFSNPYYPVIDLSSGGSIDGLIHTVDQILARVGEETKIVPGHGLLATRADLVAYRDMLVSVRGRVHTLIEAGKSMDEVVAAGPTRDFDGKWGGGYVSSAAFVQMVFSSLTAQRP